VSIFPDILVDASPEIQNNKEIVLIAVSTKAESIRHLSHRLQVDEDIVIAALQQNPDMKEYLLSSEALDKIIESDS